MANAVSQPTLGELRLKVRDPNGDPLVASVELVSRAAHVERNFLTGQNGNYTARVLPFGVYRLRISHAGFIPNQQLIQIRSEVPLRVSVTLGLAPVRSQVNVSDSATLVDPESVRTAYSVGSRAIKEELPAQIGRSLTDLVDEEPGWLYEANGILHPRGSEYDVQFVVNGVPVTENRSPAFAPAFEPGNVESMRVMTAGFPAEYGRKLGGVVEVSAPDDSILGLHLTAASEAGSFSSANSQVGIGYGQGPNQFTLTGNAGLADRYLDPPVLANYTNHGSTGGFTAAYARNLTRRQRVRFSVVHHEVRYLVPNELVQENAGQRQDISTEETGGQADYELDISPSLLFEAEGSVRDNSFNLWSNDLSTPVVIGQQRGFREGYGQVALAGHYGRHDWKVGTDAIFNPVREALQYQITNASLFDPNTPLSFSFRDRRTDLEPAAYAEDEIHLKNWNVSLGVRYDDYHFVAHESAWSPRAAVSHYYASTGLLVHASYDRIFQTPAMENLLLASSPQVDQITSLVLRLPVEPSRGNYYEAGVTKSFFGQLRLDANVFRRDFRNYSDDDTLLDTGVSFPIAYASAWIQGVEGKLELPRWGRFSGFASYANQEGVGQGPITGGLFIGAEAVEGVPDNSHFWVSQDQRNTARGHLRFQATKRLWLASDTSFGSGLPVELDTGDTDYSFLLAQYGPRILSQVDFARGRVRPSYSIDASGGINLYRKEDKAVSLEIEGSNLTNHLNLINFASLFSGTAVSVPRSFEARVKINF
ncbi:MAG: TonB-dependent receptor [Terriglobia bacterium]